MWSDVKWTATTAKALRVHAKRSQQAGSGLACLPSKKQPLLFVALLFCIPCCVCVQMNAASSSSPPSPMSSSFEEAFAPAAYHFFPDGCPSLRRDGDDHDQDADQNDNADWWSAAVRDAWPSSRCLVVPSSSSGPPPAAAAVERGGGRPRGRDNKRRKRSSPSPSSRQQRQQSASASAVATTTATTTSLRPTAVPADVARASIAELRAVALANGGGGGLGAKQIAAVAVLACACLQQQQRHQTSSRRTEKIQSPLAADAKSASTTFRSLLRCMIPVVMKPPSSGSSSKPVLVIPPDLIWRLASSCYCCAANDFVSVGGRDDDQEEQHSHQRWSSVLRYFTLLLWRCEGGSRGGVGDDDDNYSPRKQLERAYPLLFAQVLRPPSATGTSSSSSSSHAHYSIVDAVRLLLYLTKPKHAARCRVRQLRMRLEDVGFGIGIGAAANVVPSARYYRAALSRLLQVFVDIQAQQRRQRSKTDDDDDDDAKHAAAAAADANSVIFTERVTGEGDDSRWFAFPDAEWERDFVGRDAPERTPSSSSSRSPERKRRRRRFASTDLNLYRLCLPMSLRDHSVADLMNQSAALAHRFALLDVTDDAERIRIGNNLPFLIRDAWYPPPPPTSRTATYTNADGVTGTQSRLNIVNALEALAIRTGGLPVELEHFVLTDVLPAWDGSLRWGRPLAGILARLSFRSFEELHALVLVHVERLFPLLDGVVQQYFVGGALAELVCRWARTNSADDNNASVDRKLIARTLRQLIQWVNRLLLRSFLSSPSTRHHSLRACALDFFEAVSVAAASDSGNDSVFLPAPSPGICYRLLLSNSGGHVDRLCELLVSFNTVHIEPKMESSDQEVDENTLDRHRHIEIFDSCARDICGFLWDGALLSEADVDDSTTTSRDISLLSSDDWVRPQTRKQLGSKAKLLSITRGSLFVGFATRFCDDLSLASPDCIVGNVKLQYLNYLRERFGFVGVHSFLTTFTEAK